MEDLQIIDLYFERSETAIAETAAKYGHFCHMIALNILSIGSDAEECVNDTYFQAWNAIPPQRPDKLKAWLGRVVRNISINLWNKNHCQKRYAGMEQLMDELEDCIPYPYTVERKIEEQELTEVINTWLASLARQDRVMFVQRYWNGKAVNEIAKETGTDCKKIARRLYSLRQKLKSALEKEGYIL